MVRERIIADINNLDQASKIEETISTGYCDAIQDLIIHWVAVEEDLVDSYEKMSENSSVSSVKEAFERYAKQSRENVWTLSSLLEQFQSLSKIRESRVSELRSLQNTKIK